MLIEGRTAAKLLSGQMNFLYSRRMNNIEEETQTALLIIGPTLVICVVLLVIYWIRKDKSVSCFEL